MGYYCCNINGILLLEYLGEIFRRNILEAVSLTRHGTYNSKQQQTITSGFDHQYADKLASQTSEQ
jgi:hypothetical protein